MMDEKGNTENLARMCTTLSRSEILKILPDTLYRTLNANIPHPRHQLSLNFPWKMIPIKIRPLNGNL